jgi:hypothetical protein
MLLWALIWLGLLIAAGLVLGLLGRMLWRKTKALTREVGETTERLTTILASLNDLADQAGHLPAANTGGPAGGHRGRVR